MENTQQILIETQFEGLTLYVRPHETHERLMETRLVAEGYGVSEKTIYAHATRNSDEFIENKHYLILQFVESGQKRNKRFWTKRGVIRLGFFIKSERARLFRDWAEDLIIRELEKKDLYMTIKMFQKYQQQQDAKMHQYLDALYKMMKKNKKDIQELKELIHHLTQRVDKIDDYLFKPHQLPAQTAYTYLMAKKGKNEYKIGKSINPNKRKKELQIAGDSIDIITTIRFNSEEYALLWENTFKQYFQHRKISGEWFSLSEAEIAFILEVAKAFEKME